MNIKTIASVVLIVLVPNLSCAAHDHGSHDHGMKSGMKSGMKHDMKKWQGKWHEKWHNT